MSIRKKFVTNEIGRLLKTIGYKEPCIAAIYGKEEKFIIDINEIKYNNLFENDHFLLPLWQDVIDWIRNNKKYHIELQTGKKLYTSILYRERDDGRIGIDIWSSDEEIEYDKAREIAIIEAIKIINKQV